MQIFIGVMRAFVATDARRFRFFIIFGSQRMRCDYKHQCHYMQETVDFDPLHPRDETKRNETEAPGKEYKGG